MLITGAGGFIGANVTRKFLKKYDVHVISHDSKASWRLKEIRNQISVHTGDLTDFNSTRKILQKINPEIIIHLAAYGAYHYQEELDKIVQTNITGTLNLLEASKPIPYKCFISAGSSSEYGYKSKAMKETDYCSPTSYYAVTKLTTSHLCKLFAEFNNKPIVTFRLFSAYGAYEENSRFIATIMSSLIKNKQINLTPGKQRRDFIHVDDISTAFSKAIKKSDKLRGEILNLGTGFEYSNDDVVKILFKVTNKKTFIKKGAYPKRSWDTDHWKADTKKISKFLGWKPETTLDDGLYKTYKWFSKNINYY